jgi:putative membrane protein
LGAARVHVLTLAALATLLIAASLLYARGVARLWHRAGVGRGIRIADAGRFALGMAIVAAALLPPLDALADESFAMHMLEHEMLMVLAAPLFVLARPFEAWACALPRGIRQALTALARGPRIESLWRSMTAPIFATGVHASALWIWHAPALFALALASEPMHVFQHLCFFASALAFWWAMFGGAARTPAGVSVACLFVTMLHTSVLGALLTLAPSPWYAQISNPRLFGLSPLEDQQMGGLIMWVPGGLAYVIVGLAIVSTWLAPPRRVQRAAR